MNRPLLVRPRLSLICRTLVVIVAATGLVDTVIAAPQENPKEQLKPVLLDRDPALQYTIGNSSTYIRKVQGDKESAFELQLTQISIAGGFSGSALICYKGNLRIDKTSLKWNSSPLVENRSNGFEVPVSEVKLRTTVIGSGVAVLQIEAAGTKYFFQPLMDTRKKCGIPKTIDSGSLRNAEETLQKWLEKAAANFDETKRDFDAQTSSVRQADMENFQEKLIEWRAAGSKVELPEEALLHKASADEKLDKAVSEYQEALKVYPTWPDGQLKLALLLGALQRYPDAVTHMKAYIELVLDAPDSQKAQEQIWLWENKRK